MVATAPPIHGRAFQLALLTIAGMAAVYAKAALGPLQETMRTALALSDNQFALLQGPAVGLPILIAAIPLGFVIDRYSRVRLVILLSSLLVIGGLLTASASSFPLLFAARCLVGLAVIAMIPATLSLAADLYPPEQRGRASMVLLIGEFAGMSAVFALGGALVTTPGWGEEAWRTTLYWLTGPLVLIVLLMFALREPERLERKIAGPSAREAFTEFWRYRSLILPLLTGKVFALIALQAAMAWAAPSLSRAFQLAPDRVGTIIAIVMPLGGVFGTITGGFLADFGQRSGGPRQTMAVVSGMALLSAPLGLFAIMPAASLMSVSLGLAIAILTAIATIVVTLFIVAIPNEIRGLVIGILTAVGAFISVGLAPLLVSLLSSAIGGQEMLGRALALVCGTASLLSAAVFAGGRRYFPAEARAIR